jgi:predicted RNA-binding protein with PUA-like domain
VFNRAYLVFNFVMNYWAVKSEPEAYSWSQLVKDGKTAWTGVRNYQARNNLRAMKKGDLVCFYHSVTDKQIVGLARVAKEAYADATAKEGDWSCVDLEPFKPLKTPVSLEALKGDKILKETLLAKHGRISVTPMTLEQFGRLLVLAETKV